MLYQEGHIKDDGIEITKQVVVDQSTLTSDCWTVQFVGLSACDTCEYRNTPECGGGDTLKKLMK